jgi:methylated-DNA-[protein]-cysteine S-methyltransferase
MFAPTTQWYQRFSDTNVHRRPADNGVRNPPADNAGADQNFSPFTECAMSYVFKTMKSPVGPLTLVASDQGLAAVLWEGDDPSRVRLGATKEDRTHAVLVQSQQQLEEYFAGKRRKFTVKLDAAGTEFQTKVWGALRTIPFGETRSYGDIAAQIGAAKAVRAVGAANGRNPISIIVPCHRVIGANGKLTGFAGGLEVKAQLLELEGGGVSEASRQLALDA